MKICVNCGARQNDTMIYCSQCKEKLGDPISEEEQDLIEKQDKKKLEKSYKKLSMPSMLKKLFLHFLIFVPVLLSAIFTNTLALLKRKSALSFELLIVMMGILCIITFVGICIYVKYKPFNEWLLPVAFVLSPIPIYVYDYNGDWYYFFTLILTIFYTIPFFVFSILMDIILFVSKILKNKKEKTNHEHT